MLSRRKRRSRSLRMPEVSLTPLIDTAWTLLTIFMITTPMLNNAIRVDLPKTSLKEKSHAPQQQLVVSVDQKGTIFFNAQPVRMEKLTESVQDFLQKNPAMRDKSVWLKVHGDTTTCSTLATIYDQIKKVGGIENVQIATQTIATSCA